MRAMVDSRCAMAITVLPAISVSRLDWIAASTSLSSAEVASSSTRIGRIAQDHAGDGDALALAAGELDAALADLGVVAAPLLPVHEIEDELVRMGELGGGDHLRVAASGRP